MKSLSLPTKRGQKKGNLQKVSPSEKHVKLPGSYTLLELQLRMYRMLPLIHARSLPTIKFCNSLLGNGQQPESTSGPYELSPLVSGHARRNRARRSTTTPPGPCCCSRWREHCSLGEKPSIFIHVISHLLVIFLQ